MSIKKLRSQIEKSLVKLQSEIDAGKITEGFDRMSASIYTEFEEAERKLAVAESRVDGWLGMLAKSNWSLAIVILYSVALVTIGYLLGSM